MANERFIVNAANEKAIGRLVINTPTRYPIIYEPKSGLNLYKRDAYFEIPTGKEKAGLDRLATQGCLTWLKTGKAITAFSFTKALNTALADDLVGTIDGTTVTVDAPFGTDASALIATFALSDGATAKIGEVAQVSGVTENDFAASFQTYRIEAEDHRTEDFVVTVVVAES